MPANLENLAVATGLGTVCFHSNPEEGQCQRIFKLPHNCTHLTHYQVMLKILQVRLQQYMNWELPDVKVGFRKDRRNRDRVANICWIIEKARKFHKKHLLLLYWLYQSLWLFGSQQTMKNSSRDDNTRPPYLPPEKSACSSRSNN